MKASLILCVFMLITFASCDKSTVNPAIKKTPGSVLGPKNFSSNQTQTFNIQKDIDLSQGYYDINACTGDTVNIVNGIWHMVVHESISNNHIVFEQQSNIQSYKLVSRTGVEYTGSYTADFKYEGTFNNGQFAFDQTVRVKLTTPGGQNNSINTFDVHETINANGTVTASFGKFTFGCQ